jgi:hypothetical protein
MAKGKYRVFVSHAGDDVWVAEQIARNIEDCGATAFILACLAALELDGVALEEI